MTLPENELCWCSCNIVQHVIRWSKPDRCVILVCEGSFRLQRFLSCICCAARGWQLQLFIVPQDAVRWIRSIPSIGKSPSYPAALLLPIESHQGLLLHMFSTSPNRCYDSTLWGSTWLVVLMVSSYRTWRQRDRCERHGGFVRFCVTLHWNVGDQSLVEWCG